MKPEFQLEQNLLDHWNKTIKIVQLGHFLYENGKVKVIYFIKDLIIYKNNVEKHINNLIIITSFIIIFTTMKPILKETIEYL